jgi:hypothetical protein
MHLFNDCRLGWSKEPQWENDCGSFLACFLLVYSLRFKTKVTFGHNLRYETKGTFGEISLKLRQTNWNVSKTKVNVIVDELPSQSTNNLHLFNN